MNLALEDLLEDLNKPFAVQSIGRRSLPVSVSLRAKQMHTKPSPSRIQKSKRSEILKSMLDIQEILDIDTDDSDEPDIIITK